MVKGSAANQNQGNLDGETATIKLHQPVALSRPQAAVQGCSQTIYPSTEHLLHLSVILGIVGEGVI